MIHKDLITFFTTTTYVASVQPLIANRMHYGRVPEKQANVFPRLFFERSNHEDFADIDGTKGNYIEDTFNLEVISNQSSDLDIVSDKIWEDVNLYYGAVSSDVTVKGIFIEDQRDDYEPKGIGGDLGLDVASFQMRVVYSN